MTGPGNPILLPIIAPFWAGVGYVYGKMTNVSPKLCVIILTISKIADFAAFGLGLTLALLNSRGCPISLVYAFSEFNCQCSDNHRNVSF